jgi:large subunit ribosomal protein L4
MRVTVKSLENRKVREIDLPETVFAYPYKEHLIHLAVVSYLAGRRRGAADTKGRGEVSGSGRKLWKQKHTGRARMGSIRSPLWRKGGTVHGPEPRSHANKLSAAAKRNALKSALSRRLAEDGLIVVDHLDLPSHKTQELLAALARLGVTGKALLVDRHDNERLALAARNHAKLKTVDALAVNVYDIVDRPHVLVSEAALERLLEVLAP